MGPEEQSHQRSSNSGSSSCKVEPLGVRSCKRPKSKRLPQRGLGVAQLEKIRLEEQQQKVVSVVSSATQSSTTSATHNHKSSFLSLPIPNFSPPVQSGSSCSSPNVSANSVSLLQPHGNGADYRNWRELEKHISGPDPDLGFRSSFYMPHESEASEPIWPLPSLIQRAHHQFQQCSSSMMNLASSTSSSSSSLMNYQMEPPSNQSYYGNALMALMPEEEKLVGRKRLYQFTLDNLPAPSFAYKVPPVVPFLDKSYELPSSIDVGLPSFDLGNAIFRELPPCPTPTMLESYTDLTFKENGLSNGDFLTLAPPATLCKSSKPKHPSPHFSYYNHEPPGFASLPYKANPDDSKTHLGTNKVHTPRPYFSFLPPAVVQAGHGTGGLTSRKGGEVGGNVDLNLKL